jgi:hypothetical protein
MVEHIEELGLCSKLHPLPQRKSFREIEVIVTEGLAAEVSELAMLWVVATDALPSTRINGGNKRGRIEPLEGARLRYTSERNGTHRAGNLEPRWRLRSTASRPYPCNGSPAEQRKPSFAHLNCPLLEGKKCQPSSSVTSS